MSNQKASPDRGMEEYVILIPFVISVVLSLAAFLLKFVNPDTSKLMTTLSYYAYAWLCCISVSQCVRRNKHLQICLFENVFPESVAKFADLLSQLVGFLVVVGVFVGSFVLLKGALTTGATDPNMPQIPLALGYFAPIFGYGWALIRYAMRVVKGGKAK